MKHIPIFISSIVLLPVLLLGASVFAAGNQFTIGVTVVSDLIPPTAPTGLVATPVSSSQIDLSWNAATDNVGVVGYVVNRGGIPIATTTFLTYSNTGLSASTLYSYTVVAYDATPNYSPASGADATTTLAIPPGGGGGGGDTTPPAVGSFSPPNSSTGVAVTSSLQMTMTELVNKVSGNITIRRSADDTIVESIPVSGGSVTVSGTVVTIVPSASFQSATSYYVTADPGTFMDQSGNNFPGFSGNSTWTFTTVDGTPPVISGVTASTTLTSATVSFTTNEPALSSIEWGTTTTYGTGLGSEVTYGVVHAMGISGLTSGTLYYYRITATDPSGNVSVPYTGSFTTTSPPPPPDTTPPANPSGFLGVPSLSSIALSWSNPADVDFSAVRIMRSSVAYPVDPFDGILVYDGVAESHGDTGLLSATRYYYTAFARDVAGNYSSGAIYTGVTNTVAPPPPPPPPDTGGTPPPPPGGSTTPTPVGTTPTTTPGGTFQPPSSSTSTDPFVGFIGTGTPDVRVKVLRLSDVNFTELGESSKKLPVQNDTVVVNADRALEVSIPVEKLPARPLTIAISLEQTAHASPSSYLLSLTGDHTAYRVVVPGFNDTGKQRFTIRILDDERSNVTELSGIFDVFRRLSPIGIIPPQIAQVVTDITQAIQEPVSSVAPIVTPVGVAVGASQAILLSTNVGSVYDLYLLLLKFIGLLTGVFRRKKNEPWGVVYDSVTKRPLDPAYVIARIRESVQSKGEAITDLDGRYGFFLNPGEYIIEANKTHYKFPSEKLKGKARDELYDNLYFGDPFHVREGGVVQYNIPLDPVEFDWNEFAKNQDQVFKVYSKRKNIRIWLFNILFYVGFLFSLGTLLLSFSILNVAVVGVYGSMLVFQIIWKATHKITFVKNSTTGKPLPFALIKVWLPGLNTIVKKTVSDQFGRFYFLVPPGNYFLTVEQKLEDGSYKEVLRTSPRDLPGGVVKEDLLV